MFYWLVEVQRHGRKIRLPRQRVRNDAATLQVNSYTVHSTLTAARRLVASDAGSQSNRTSKHVASSRVGALCQGVGWNLRVVYR